MNEAARLNARIAVELDPVRRHDRLNDLRLAAAVILAPRVIVVEGLLAGLAIPSERLDPLWVKALGLSGDVVLDDELALEVIARGPIEEEKHGR